MSDGLEAVIGTLLSDDPYQVWVVGAGLPVLGVEPLGRFPFDLFTTSVAANLNDFLSRRGYVVVGPWKDQVEFRVATVVSTL